LKNFAAPLRAGDLSCFASSIHRIQQIIDIAARVNRKWLSSAVAWSTRGDRALAGAAADSRRHGGATQDIRGFDPKRIIFLASGSQAEPMSSLSRIAVTITARFRG